MTMNAGAWTTEQVGGHPCDLYEPPTRNPHGYVGIYLHGVHLQRLANQPAFTAELSKHGLPVIAPQTQRSWWTDRICEEFDPTISAEKHVLTRVLPWIAE